MSADKIKNSDYKPLSSQAAEGGTSSRDRKSLKPPSKSNINGNSFKNLTSPFKKSEKKESPSEPEKTEIPVETDFSFLHEVSPKADENLTFAEQAKLNKENKRVEKDRALLSGERWLARNGHTLTYIGLYIFSIMVFFRPYELIPGLSFLTSTAVYFAVATLLIYVPTQLSTEGNLTTFPTEVKCILAITLLALVTMPIAKSPGLAWAEFNEPFIKVVLMFIVMINVLRTRQRLMGLMWLSLGMGIYLSYTALGMFARGEAKLEGYRVAVDVGGMFGNPNEMSMHLVMMTPIAFCLAIAAKSNVMRFVYFAMAALFIGANFVTYSRGGFLGLVAAAAILAWKLGRKNRLNVSLASIVIGFLVILFAPGNYGLRVLSIFFPNLDPVGSNDQRRELLERSIVVTLRNPWGIGIGNFPIVGIRNLVSHNAFTQVSSELGILGLIAYLILMISPFRKLGAIERTLFKKNEHDWFYYLSIGLQASIVSYMVSSFFASVAYNWFIYYIIAYAVAFRRIYTLEKGVEIETESLKEKFLRFKTA